jgi:chemotaxis protein methyltransferase WspC
MIGTPDNVVEIFLSRMMGLDPESIGRKGIDDVVCSAMAKAGADDAHDYVRLLSEDAGELERLVERLVVPETWFFRDGGAFNFLRAHLRELARPPGGKPLRFLSAPCATGEEPYSIAMVLLEMGLSSDAFHIDGVDISAKAIETAKRAIYGKGSFREKNTGCQQRFFTRVQEGERLDPDVARLVHFHTDNFVRPDALAGHERYDIVFCKNLLIYLTEDGRKQVFANLDRLLCPEGLLFTGHSEMISFLQYGYRAVRHERAFACTRTGEAPAGQAQQVKNRTPSRQKARPAPVAPAEVRGRKKTAISRDDGKKNSAPDEKRAASILAEIRRLADMGALDEASRRCEEFFAQYSPDKEAFYLMGLIHLARNSFAQAEVFFQKALYMDPRYYDALVHLELLREQKGDLTGATIMRKRIERLQETAAEGRETR